MNGFLVFLAHVHRFCFTYLTSEDSGIISRWMLSRHSELVTAGYLLTWRALEPASGAGLGLVLLSWLASSHGRVCPAAPLSSLPVTHGKAQPGNPGAEFLSVTKSVGVPINIFL